MSTTVVDNDAKLRVPLFRMEDAYKNEYYIGKLQFPGTLDLEKGASFMIFTAEHDMEELQIGPIDEGRRSNRVRQSNSARALAKDKLVIDMHPCTDGKGNKFYVGEAQCPANIDLDKGVFFTFFNSKEGKEELQIGRLQHKKRAAQHDSGEHVVDDNTGRYSHSSV